MRSSNALCSVLFILFRYNLYFKHLAPIFARDKNSVVFFVVGDAVEYIGCGVYFALW